MGWIFAGDAKLGQYRSGNIEYRIKFLENATKIEKFEIRIAECLEICE